MEARERAGLHPLLILFLAGFFFCGCSKQDWLSRAYVFRAEEAFSKAYTMRLKKGVSYHDRLRYYRKACEFFLKAYEHSDRTFTLNRIDAAAEACMRVEDYETEKKFRAFGESYIKAHPTETEYGDAVPIMNLE